MKSYRKIKKMQLHMWGLDFIIKTDTWSGSISLRNPMVRYSDTEKNGGFYEET